MEFTCLDEVPLAEDEERQDVLLFVDGIEKGCCGECATVVLFEGESANVPQ